jgi:hypothetical protein
MLNVFSLSSKISTFPPVQLLVVSSFKICCLQATLAGEKARLRKKIKRYSTFLER